MTMAAETILVTETMVGCVATSRDDIVTESRVGQRTRTFPTIFKTSLEIKSSMNCELIL